jgi:hypothetical protein
MATADPTKALFRSHDEADDTRLHPVAMQVAAHAARSGHGKFALELRGLVDGARAKQPPTRSSLNPAPVSITHPRGELTGLLAVAYAGVALALMMDRLAPHDTADLTAAACDKTGKRAVRARRKTVNSDELVDALCERHLHPSRRPGDASGRADPIWSHA